jgi:hypothetical protein
MPKQSRKPKLQGKLTHRQKRVLEELQLHVGVENLITAEKILPRLDFLFREVAQEHRGRHLRIEVNAIRKAGYPVCSQGGKGYWWPKNLNEIKNSAEKEFRSKARDLLTTAASMEEAGLVLFEGQGELL